MAAPAKRSLVDAVVKPATPAKKRKITGKRASETSARNQEYPCTVADCDRVFDRPCRRDEHVRSHTGERPFICDEPDCGKTFARDYHYKRHFKQAHTDQRDYPCSHEGCTSRFATAQRLKRHEDGHESAKPVYNCLGYGDCTETFRKKSTLQAHINSVHLQTDPYTCGELDESTLQVCGKGFPSSNSYQRHLKDVHGPPTYFCSVCPSVVPGTPMAMDFTPLAVEGSMPGTPASTQTSLSIHAFRTEHQLKQHIASHHEELAPVKDFAEPKEWPCTILGCDKVFSKSSNLTTHIRAIHKQIKRFVCGETDLSDCKSMQDANGDYIWEGGQGCGQSFTYKMSLQDHVRSDHLGIEKARTIRARKARDSLNTKKAVKKPNLVASAAARLLGSATMPELRKHACLIDGCVHRFYREYDLQNHCVKMHAIPEDQVRVMLIERQAELGGQFWIGGVDPRAEREDDEEFWYGGIDPEEERLMRAFEDAGVDGTEALDPSLREADAMEHLAERAFAG